MSDRYFSEIPISEGPIRLAGAEAHHLIHVMRARPGSQVVLFDGSGAEFVARVECVDRGEVGLAVVSRREVDRELAGELTLGVALPKGDRQRWLVEKAVELGVARVVPLRTERSVAMPVRQALDRLRRTVVEASKQCGRNRLMEIAAPQGWSDYVAETGDSSWRLVAHPGGRPMGEVLASLGEPARRMLLAVGPEGGLTDQEVSLATAAGWQTVDLGPRILRVETAALQLAGIVAEKGVRTIYSCRPQ